LIRESFTLTLQCKRCTSDDPLTHLPIRLVTKLISIAAPASGVAGARQDLAVRGHREKRTRSFPLAVLGCSRATRVSCR